MQHVRALKPGIVVAQRWRIARVLGTGGFGVTYEATGHGDHERVALKEYMPVGCCSRDPRSSHVTAAPGQEGDVFRWGRERFITEAKTLARLEHPSIVKVADFFEANGTAYMALAYEKGGTLKDWLGRLGRRPTGPEVEALLWALTDALAQVHSLFLLHRDIKPDNIMMRSDGTPVLIDFGAIRSAVTEHTQLLGVNPTATAAFAVVSDGYSPPEQYDPSGRLMGPASDIYALGATAYTMLVGERPPSSASRHLHDTYEPLVRRLAGEAFRPELLAGIDRALAIHPRERPQSALEFRRALGLTGPDAGADRTLLIAPVDREPAPAPVSPPVPEERAEPPGPDHRARSWRWGALALALAMAAAGGFWWNDQAAKKLKAFQAEIEAARTVETLDTIARRAPHLASEIDRRRTALVASLEAERLRDLRDWIGRETSIEALDWIATSEPSLKSQVAARKSALPRTARPVDPPSCDEGFGSLMRTIAGKQICIPFSEALLKELDATVQPRVDRVRAITEDGVAALRKRDIDGLLGFARAASSVVSVAESRKFAACFKGSGLWARAIEATPSTGPSASVASGDPSLQALKTLETNCSLLQFSPVFPLANASLVLFQSDNDRSEEAGAWLDESVANSTLGGVIPPLLANPSFQLRVKEVEDKTKDLAKSRRLSVGGVLEIISSGRSYHALQLAAAKAAGTSYIPAQHIEAARAWWRTR